MIKDNTLTAVLVIFSLSMVFSQEDSDFSDALYSFEKQEYLKAYRYFSVCADKDSSALVCYEKAGQSAFRLGDIPGAKKYFHQLEKLDTSSFIAFSQLSSIYEMENNIPKAIKYYTHLKNLYPENPIYHRKLGQQYQSAGIYKDAFVNYSRALELNGRDMYSIKGTAEIFIANKQYGEADTMLNRGLLLDELNVSLNLLIAQSKYRQKAFDSTVHYLEKIKYEIDFSPYFNKMFGYAYIQIDSFDKSIPLLEKSLVDEGSKEYAHYYLAIAYENLENEEYASFHYQKAVEEGISENLDLYHRNLARLYNDKNQLKDAITHYQDAYKYGKDPLVLFYLARACDMYYKDKNIAVNYYKKYLKSGDKTLEYVQYSKDRKRVLQEQIHQGK